MLSKQLNIHIAEHYLDLFKSLDRKKGKLNNQEIDFHYEILKSLYEFGKFNSLGGEYIYKYYVMNEYSFILLDKFDDVEAYQDFVYDTLSEFYYYLPEKLRNLYSEQGKLLCKTDLQSKPA